MKIAIIGISEVGKSSYINRITTGILSSEISTNKVHFQVHGQSIWVEFFEYQFVNDSKFFDGYIVMFDRTNNASFESSCNALDKIGNKPKILVGNKCEARHRTVSNASVRQAMDDHEVTFYDISARTTYQIYKPIQYLLQKIVEVPHA